MRFNHPPGPPWWRNYPPGSAHECSGVLDRLLCVLLSAFLSAVLGYRCMRAQWKQQIFFLSSVLSCKQLMLRMQQGSWHTRSQHSHHQKIPPRRFRAGTPSFDTSVVKNEFKKMSPTINHQLLRKIWTCIRKFGRIKMIRHRYLRPEHSPEEN